MTLGEFAQMAPSANGPARSLVAIDFDTAPTSGDILRGVFNGSADPEDIDVTLINGDTITIPNVPSGFIFPVFCQFVNTTNTTATEAELLGVI